MTDRLPLKYYLDLPCGVRYSFDTLETSSSVSLRFLSERPMMTDAEEIGNYYAVLKAYYSAYVDGKLNDAIIKLCRIRDIRNTISRLSSGTVIDDVELFEVKSLAILNEEIREIFPGSRFLSLPSLEKPLSLLDPSGNRVTSFYIYDSYSEELRAVRRRLEAAEGTPAHDDLLREAIIIEDSVRENICRSLRVYCDALYESLLKLIDMDIYIAQAAQIHKYSLCFPSISTSGITEYRGMFSPAVKNSVESSGGRFFPNDMEFGREPVTITGANMGGKTVAIKTVALNQILFQFGFGIAARSASVDVKSAVMLSVGDEQCDTAGISSFAAEMKSIDAMIHAADTGQPVLAVVDEPARTTNPVEGTALVDALISRMAGTDSTLVLTTHYNIANRECRRYRVKGLHDGAMDYTLEPADSSDVPKEALDIAESMKIDPEWLRMARLLLN